MHDIAPCLWHGSCSFKTGWPGPFARTSIICHGPWGRHWLGGAASSAVLFQGRLLSGYQKHPPHEARELHHVPQPMVSLGDQRDFHTRNVNAYLVRPWAARSSVTYSEVERPDAGAWTQRLIYLMQSKILHQLFPAWVITQAGNNRQDKSLFKMFLKTSTGQKQEATMNFQEQES